MDTVLFAFRDYRTHRFFKKWEAGQPAFYRFEAELSEIGDTYLDLSEFGKGIVWVNGTNIGRFGK